MHQHFMLAIHSKQCTK